jgi:hypothetical protein
MKRNGTFDLASTTPVGCCQMSVVLLATTTMDATRRLRSRVCRAGDPGDECILTSVFADACQHREYRIGILLGVANFVAGE